MRDHNYRVTTKDERELLVIGGREVAISNPGKVLFPAGRATPSSISCATTSPSPTARCAAPAAGRTCSCAIPNGIDGEFFYQKRAPAVAAGVDRGRRAAVSRRAARAEEVVPRDAAALAWMANLACLELHPHPVRADDLDHPDELRVDLDPVPGVDVAAGPRGRAAWCSATLDGLRPRRLAEDVGLARHARQRAHRAALDVRPRCAARRWRSRARSSGARRRSRRASGGRKSATACSSTTTRTRRTARSPAAYSVRPTPDARVSAPLDVGRGRRRAIRPTSRWRRCRRASRQIGDRHAGDRRARRARSTRCSSCRRGTSARAWATRRGRRTTGSRRASRRACSRRAAASPKHPLIEIGRAQREGGRARRARALEGAPSRGGGASRSRPTCWSTRCAAAFAPGRASASTCSTCPTSCGRRRSRSIPTTTPNDWRRQPTARRAEDLLELVRRS